jgi:hypothetical protein
MLTAIPQQSAEPISSGQILLIFGRQILREKDLTAKYEQNVAAERVSRLSFAFASSLLLARLWGGSGLSRSLTTDFTPSKTLSMRHMLLLG